MIERAGSAANSVSAHNFQSPSFLQTELAKLGVGDPERMRFCEWLSIRRWAVLSTREQQPRFV
jgi:hypothetical protein